MVRVRYIDTKELTTVGVCPGCWNIPERRRDLLIKLKKMGLEVAYKADMLNGTYQWEKEHAPNCPYNKVAVNPWNRFNNAMKRYR
jgi:hypothetical protein